MKDTINLQSDPALTEILAHWLPPMAILDLCLADIMQGDAADRFDALSPGEQHEVTIMAVDAVLNGWAVAAGTLDIAVAVQAKTALQATAEYLVADLLSTEPKRFYLWAHATSRLARAGILPRSQGVLDAAERVRLASGADLLSAASQPVLDEHDAGSAPALPWAANLFDRIAVTSVETCAHLVMGGRGSNEYLQLDHVEQHVTVYLVIKEIARQWNRTIAIADATERATRRERLCDLYDHVRAVIVSSPSGWQVMPMVTRESGAAFALRPPGCPDMSSALIERQRKIPGSIFNEMTE